MDTDAIRFVRENWVTLDGQHEALADRFYVRLFEIAPSFRPMFPADLSVLRRKFADMLDWILRNLDHATPLVTGLADLGQRHVGYGVEREHYAAVGDALIWALDQSLGDRFTDAHRAAWHEAYYLISGLMLRRRSAELKAMQ